MMRSMLYYLKKNAQESAERTALGDEHRSITYREYYDCACRIGGYLIKNITGTMIKHPIAVIIDRNVTSVLAFMGCAMSGNFYVPVDPTMPAQRVNTIFTELEPVAILDARDEGEVYEGAVCVRDILQMTSDDAEYRALAESRLGGLIDIDPIYATFTSGSTGIPKGVLTAHRSVVDLTDAFEEVFHFDSDCVFGNQAPFDFDGSVKDIYNALHCGGRVQIIPKKMFVMPKLLIPYLAEHGVNTVIWAVSAVRIVSDFKAMDQCEEAKQLNLRYVMFSGEVMPVKSINYWIDHFPETVYVNLYGPTESTCNCTYYILDKRYEPGSVLPAGKAFPNMRVFLLDKDQKLITESGQVGEICVSGTGLSLGYYHRPERTAESFVQNPLTADFRDLMYRTGDLGYYDEEHRLFFSSRADSQIKHMGHRIELGEIEAALNGMEFIQVACCLYDAERQKIVCLYQAEAEAKKAIVAGLADKLPKYMWPNRYVWFEKLPVNSHGKIDRASLKKQLLNKEI